MRQLLFLFATAGCLDHIDLTRFVQTVTEIFFTLTLWSLSILFCWMVIISFSMEVEFWTIIILEHGLSLQAFEWKQHTFFHYFYVILSINNSFDEIQLTSAIKTQRVLTTKLNCWDQTVFPMIWPNMSDTIKLKYVLLDLATVHCCKTEFYLYSVKI